MGLFLHKDGDVLKAKSWYKKAAEQGHKEAQNNYGVLQFEEGKTKEAKKWFEKSANQNYAAAQNNLGVLYHGARNFKQAQFLYQKAAEQENSDAQTNLAMMFLEQENNSEDAKKWLEKASQQGHPAAQNNLGFLLHKEGNLSEAKKMFHMSADQGFVLAQHNLGYTLHNEGKIEDAKKWFEKSATQGYAPNKNNTSDSYDIQKDTTQYISKIIFADTMGKINQRGSVSFYASGGGHFIIGSKINDTIVHFLLDTGATNVVLTEKDARKLGINFASLNYDTKVVTAKGVGYVSCFNLSAIKVGNIVIKNVKSCVMGPSLSRSLLGMSFLNKISKYEVSKGRITFWK